MIIPTWSQSIELHFEECREELIPKTMHENNQETATHTIV